MAVETSGRSMPSPAVTPPFLDFTGYRLSGVGPMASRDEPRQSPRRPLYCKMLLVDNVMYDNPDPTAIPGECLNVCDGGLYGTIPLGYGVTIGQRYTFRLMVDERGPEPGSHQTVSQQGVIVRAELLVHRDGSGDRLGIGVKLFGHRTGHIPMPMWT
jgi:hypothetical protein